MPEQIERYPDWPERLAAVLAQHQRTPFVWGEHDCCLFAASVVQALTGVDPAAGWRGTYSTEEQAQALIEEAGGLLALATSALGAPRNNPQLVQRGDVVCAAIYPEVAPDELALADGVLPEPKWLLGVATGAGWCAPSKRGLVHRRLDDVVAVWAV
jgi:hypothetical protein